VLLPSTEPVCLFFGSESSETYVRAAGVRHGCARNDTWSRGWRSATNVARRAARREEGSHSDMTLAKSLCYIRNTQKNSLGTIPILRLRALNFLHTPLPILLVDHRCFDVLVLHYTVGEPTVLTISKNMERIAVSTHSEISFSAFSTESDPWQMFLPTARAKSPRMVPRGVISLTTTWGLAGHTWRRGERVGCTKHHAPRLNSIETLPNHADDRARGHVLDQAWEEGLALEIGVVCGCGAISDRGR
jgi:hypothetical protein